MAPGFYPAFPGNHDECAAGLTRFFGWGPDAAAALDADALVRWCERAVKIAEQERG